ncbi:MAG: hypothetical protein WCY89_03640 [Flavobacteriaceae bacterium]
MKKILLCGVLVSLITLLSSCDNEELTSSHQQQLKKTSPSTSSDNPFDAIGVLHNVLFDAYVASNNRDDTIEGIAVKINELITGYSNLEPTTIAINAGFTDRVEQILNYPEHSLDIIVSEVGLSVRVKTKLNDLIELASGVTINDYPETGVDVISYEKGIITDVSLTPEEKEVLLTVSSIVKYSLYDNGDRKDKDWDLSVGNIVATAYGAAHSGQDALLMGLTTKIFQNYLSVNQ